MYLELAEGGSTLEGHRRKRPVRYLPFPNKGNKVFAREDQFDALNDNEFMSFLSEAAPHLSENEIEQLSKGRKERKAAKRATKQQKRQAKADKKSAKAEIKNSKADYKRSKGQAKIIKAQAKQDKANNPNAEKFSYSDVVQGITDTAGAITPVVQAIKGTTPQDGNEQQYTNNQNAQSGFMGMNIPKPLLIGGAVVGIGLLIFALKPKNQSRY